VKAYLEPEEVEKFYASLRPAKVEDYEFPKPAEGQTVDEDFLNAARAMFHTAGLSKAQVAKLIPEFDKYVAEKSAPGIEAAKKLDADFKVMMDKTFGAEAAATLARSKSLLETLTPDTLKPHLVKLPNEALVVLTGIMESVRAKYMKEDGGSGDGGGGNGGSATDVASLREQMRGILVSDAWKDYKHKDHTTVQAKVASISEAIAKAGTTGGK